MIETYTDSRGRRRTRDRSHHHVVSTPVFREQRDAEIDILPEGDSVSLKIQSRGVEATATLKAGDLDWLLLELTEERNKLSPPREDLGTGSGFFFLFFIAAVFAAGFLTATFW